VRFDFDQADFAPLGLGILALALGVGAVLGIVRPEDAAMADNVPVLAFASLVVGVIGLYVGRTTGPGRQVAIIGAATGLIAVALFAGSVAVEAILESTG